ncbi:hypothetical protein SNEBB_010055 [Seison nebaliae]|nr:hypothetical protein SNEBB_010055 [Seison nebaliae]
MRYFDIFLLFSFVPYIFCDPLYEFYNSSDYNLELIIDDEKNIPHDSRLKFCTSNNSTFLSFFTTELIIFLGTYSGRVVTGNIIYNKSKNYYQWQEHPFLYVTNDCELWGHDQPFDSIPPEEAVTFFAEPSIQSYLKNGNFATVCAKVIYKKTVNINLTTEKKRNKSMKYLINSVTEGMRKSTLNNPVNCYKSQTEDVVLDNYYLNLKN